MNTVAEMWARNARRYPDRLALVCEGTRRTYGEIYTRAKMLGAALHGVGVGRQDRVALMAMNCPEWMDFYAACEVSGYVAATVNFRLAAPEVEYTVKDAAPRVLIFEARYSGLIAQIRAQLTSVEHFVCIGGAPDWALEFETLLASGSEEGAPLIPEPEDYVRLVYTSGTTGKPKGAIKTQRAEVKVARKIASIMDMTGGTSTLLMMPMFHVGAQLEQIGQHWAGGTVILQRTFDTAAVLDAIQDEKIQIVHMAPTMVQRILEEQDVSQWDLSSLETFCYAAAPMPVTVLEEAVGKFGPIFCDIYGSTEIGPITTLYKHLHVLKGTEEETKRLASVGQSVPGSEIKVLDAECCECPLGQPGEVFIRSDSMFSGYWNNTAATVEVFRGGWYASGDVGYLDERDYLYLVDRTKDMIISGGENIYCREVEEALMLHPEVRDVAVIGVPDEKWGETVKAVAIREGGSTLSETVLIAFCREQIARYKAPKTVAFVEDLPRLPSGKISKTTLREIYSGD